MTQTVSAPKKAVKATTALDEEESEPLDPDIKAYLVIKRSIPGRCS